MYDDIKRYAEEHLSQGYSLSSIRTAIAQNSGEKVANKVIAPFVEERARLQQQHLKDMKERGFDDASIRSMLQQEGHDPLVIESLLSTSGPRILPFVIILGIISLGVFFAFQLYSPEMSLPEMPRSDIIDRRQSLEFQASLSDHEPEIGDDLSIGLAFTDYGNLDQLTMRFRIRDASGSLVDEMSRRLDIAPQVSERISTSDLEPGDYTLEIRSETADAEERLLEFALVEETSDAVTDTGEADDEDDDPSEVEETPGMTDEELEQEVAELLGHTPDRILTVDQIYANAEQMPLIYANQYCSNFPEEIALECLRRAEEAAAIDIDEDECEMVEMMGREICVVRHDPDDMKDSYCDYVNEGEARDMCEFISKEYDGVVELLRDSDLGLGFGLIVFSGGDFRQLDFPDPEEEED